MTLKQDLKALQKEFKTLGKKVEKLTKTVEKAEKTQAKAAKAKTVKKTPIKKKAPAKKAPAKKRIAKLTATDQVLRIIKGRKRGIDVATLAKKTGFDDKKVRNIVFRVLKQGKIKRAGRGIYVGA